MVDDNEVFHISFWLKPRLIYDFSIDEAVTGKSLLTSFASLAQDYSFLMQSAENKVLNIKNALHIAIGISLKICPQSHWRSVPNKRHHLEALRNKLIQILIFIPHRLEMMPFCLELNFNISKVGYYLYMISRHTCTEN